MGPISKDNFLELMIALYTELTVREIPHYKKKIKYTSAAVAADDVTMAAHSCE